jgi:hypothetical protein
MKQSLLILTCLLAASLQAQEPEKTVITPLAAPRIIVEQTVVRQKDGGTVTFQKIQPPPVTAPVVKAAPVLTPEEAARQAEIEAKKPGLLMVSATVHAGGLTVLRCSCGGKEQVEALSNVDFQLLAGLGQVETETGYYSLVMAVGTDEAPLSVEQEAQARVLTAKDGAAFVLMGGKAALSAAEEEIAAGLQVLHEYFDANRAALADRHAKREQERAARALIDQSKRPAAAKQAVIQFWPLSAEQKTALRATRSAEPAAKTSSTGGTK